MKIWLSSLLFLCTYAGWAQAEPLGRLFFTPEQRAILEHHRQQGSAHFDQEASYTLNGEVRRSAGPNTRWLNGQAQNANSAPSGIIGDTYHPATGTRDSLLGGGQLIVTPRR